MAKLIGRIEAFVEDIVHGVPSHSWYPAENSPLESICEFLLGFDDGDYYKDGVPMKHIKQDGGGEGGSEHCETVVQVGDVYYKIVYSYYSYNGYDYDGAEVYEVVPVEKLVTFYE